MQAAAAQPSSHQLLIVGPGVLGSNLGKRWLDAFGPGQVVGQTNSTANHDRCGSSRQQLGIGYGVCHLLFLLLSVQGTQKKEPSKVAPATVATSCPNVVSLLASQAARTAPLAGVPRRAAGCFLTP